MVPVKDTGHFDAETQAIRWATGEEARRLIQLNQKPKRRRRDLRVLKLALALLRSLELALYRSDATQPQLQPFGTTEPQ